LIRLSFDVQNYFISFTYSFNMKTLLIMLGVVVLVAVGYGGYTYLKEDPPDPLIKLVASQDEAPPLPQGERAPLDVPAGFSATIYSRETPGARALTRDPKGVMLVSLTSVGKIVALPDYDQNGMADETKVVLEGLDHPHGLLILCPQTGSVSADQDACLLYVAESGMLASYHYDADTLTVKDREELGALPTQGGGHFTRTLLLHPNGEEILVSVGSSCNVCEEEDEKRATVLSFNLENKTLSAFATGLRNTVFMATDPVTGKVWGTDNGRDVIGDDIPPDEVNVIEKNKFYGWPYCYGNNVYDTDFNKENEEICRGATPPHIELQAHSAALGIAFIPEEGFPEDMRNDVLLAYHGSWNRSTPTGYKVVRFDLASGGERQSEGGPLNFLSGFLAEGADEDAAIGRPVGILAEPGGIVYVTDDKAGAVYRIAYTGNE
jgi:glucose/arabinose dehydrogenase